MKKYIYIAFAGLLFVSIMSCEKNDSLAKLGELTGNEIANVNLSKIEDTSVGDTAKLTTNTWAVNDNIEKLEYAHKGYKTSTIAVTWTVEIDAETIYEFEEKFDTDTVFIDSTVIVSLTNLDEFYQTIMNAYVVKYDFIIPADYTVLSSSGKNVITDMNIVYFNRLVNLFIEDMDKEIVEYLFPGTVDDRTLFETDFFGSFTGNLTEAGKTYVLTNLTKEMITSRPSTSSEEEFGECTVFSSVTLQTGEAEFDNESFEIIVQEN